MVGTACPTAEQHPKLGFSRSSKGKAGLQQPECRVTRSHQQEMLGTGPRTVSWSLQVFVRQLIAESREDAAHLSNGTWAALLCIKGEMTENHDSIIY